MAFRHDVKSVRKVDKYSLALRILFWNIFNTMLEASKSFTTRSFKMQYIEDLIPVVISYEIYETSLRRVT